MIKEVYEILVKEMSEIKNKLRMLDESKNSQLIEKIKEKWVPYCSNGNLTKTFLAIDGGSWIKELRSGFIYIIDAEVVKAEGYKVTPLESKAMVGVLRPGNLAKERVSLLMQLLELKLATKHGNEADYILLDGSITKKIGKHNFSSTITLLDDINPLDDKIYSLEEKNEDLMHKYLIAENQVIISHLVEKYKEKLVWISKNSKSTELFNEETSDISLLELFTKECGYTVPLSKSFDKKSFISEKALNTLSETQFYSSYIRLKEGEKVLKIDIFKSDIKELIDSLIPISIKGYPFPLLKVHTDVKISKDDRERIQQLLNIRKRDIEWWPNQLF